MRAEGLYTLEATVPSGEVYRREGRNLIVTVGRKALADLMFALNTPSAPSHLVMGSGSNSPLLTDIALQTEQFAYDMVANADLFLTFVEADGKEFVLQMLRSTQATYSGSSFSLNEMGIFGRRAGKTAVMFSRFLVQPFTVTTGTKFVFGWELHFKDA